MKISGTIDADAWRSANGVSVHEIELCGEVSEEAERQRRLDLFATAALTGMMASDLTYKKDGSRTSWDELAEAAWTCARAVLDNEPKDEP